jgi:hypothetical protein
MKKLILNAVIAATVLSFVSCDSECEERGGSVPAESILTINAVPVDDTCVATKSPISVFPEHAELGLFVTSGTLGNNYNNIPANSNVKSTLRESVWIQTPAVYLSTANATVFAYYPYSNENTDGTKVAVEHTSQTDYLYGIQYAGQSAVNNANPNVNIGMHHALAMIQFQFVKSNYTSPGKLTKIEIFNSSGTVLCSEGTMNIATGEITNTIGKSASASIENISEGLVAIPETASADVSTYPKVLVLPLKKEVASGNISIRFTIDGRSYTLGVPSGTKWEKSTKYTYKIRLSGTEIKVGETSITDWIVGATENAEIG